VQVLLGPTTILAVAGFSFTVPEFARRARTMTTREWTTAATGLSVAVAGLGLLWGLLWLVAPDTFGRFLLGATWTATDAVLAPTVIGQAAAAAAIGPAAMLNAMHASHEFCRARRRPRAGSALRLRVLRRGDREQRRISAPSIPRPRRARSRDRADTRSRRRRPRDRGAHPRGVLRL